MRLTAKIATATAVTALLVPVATAASANAATSTARQSALTNGIDLARHAIAYGKKTGKGPTSTKVLNDLDAASNRNTGGRLRVWGIQDVNRNGHDDDRTVYVVAWNKAHTRWTTVATVKFKTDQVNSGYTVTTTIR